MQNIDKLLSLPFYLALERTTLVPYNVLVYIFYIFSEWRLGHLAIMKNSGYYQNLSDKVTCL